MSKNVFLRFLSVLLCDPGPALPGPLLWQPARFHPCPYMAQVRAALPSKGRNTFVALLFYDDICVSSFGRQDGRLRSSLVKKGTLESSRHDWRRYLYSIVVQYYLLFFINFISLCIFWAFEGFYCNKFSNIPKPHEGI